MKRLLVLGLLVLPGYVQSAICPMDEHQICNPDFEDHTCTCSVAQSDENPVKAQSCNTMIKRDENGNFPVVSVQLTLDDSVDSLDEWPEQTFREAIASSLRVNEDDVIILRVNCKGTEDQLTVQFGILKKQNNNENGTEIPYDEEDFVDAESIATRMKAMGHLSSIADLDVDNIEYTDELIDLEYEPDNSELIMQTIVISVSFILMILLAIYCICRRGSGEEYQDDLQKA
ncbi:hypothetical protein WR25_12701 [Diploscapter pachys]|uniref:Uncharacterized protein n=1 Tax=Diploscapter pachys TaxID=2018661 RepID=A0A2A2LLF8_9BILA|nr:hypothetical protein WR25_12701 [Diploscapter pachys]